MRTWILGGLVVLSMMVAPVAQAQLHSVPLSVAQGDILDVNRPRIDVAPDGTVAIAAEVLVADAANSTAWQVAVQLFTPGGDPIGEPVLFEAEDGNTILWDVGGYVHNAEIAFHPEGALVVLMQHTGRLEGARATEVTVGAVGLDGQILDLNSNQRKVQQSLFLPSATAQGFAERRPRLALTPDGVLLVALEGSSQRSQLRYVALKALDAQLNELTDQFIPHDDPNAEESYHVFPDVVTNGTLGLAAWQECPVVDAQGNADDCDIVAQFFTDTAQGGNLLVNAGDAFGTLNLRPSAAMNAGGSSVVVWVDTRTGPQGEVFAQRFDDAGQPVGANFQVSTGARFIHDRPEVALMDDGRFMVVWTDSSAVGYRAYGRRFDASGTPREAPFLLQGPTAASGLPAVAAGTQDFTYVWVGEQNGAATLLSNAPGLTVANEATAGVPDGFALHPNYPNPFNPATTVAYDLPEAAEVRLAVHDLLGREVAVLVNGPMLAGRHQARFEAGALASGVYLARLRASTFVQTRRLVLLK